MFVSNNLHRFVFDFLHRARAALRALSRRCSTVSFFAVAFPPRLPSFTAAGSFFGMVICTLSAQRWAIFDFVLDFAT